MISRFYNNTSDLEKINWEIMGATYWNNTPEDNDRMRRRMAELLVYKFMPQSCIFGIVVKDDVINKFVAKLLENFNLDVKLIVKPQWYY